MKTAAQKYSESNAEAILAYFRGVDGTFVPTPAHPSPRYPMVDDTVGIHTVRLSQSTLAGYLEQAFVAGERANTGQKMPALYPCAACFMGSLDKYCSLCGGTGKATLSQNSEYRRQFPLNAANKPDGMASEVGELIRHDESRTDEKLRQMIAEADAEADRNDGREPGDTRDEESLEDHNIQGLGAFRDVFDAGGEQ